MAKIETKNTNKTFVENDLLTSVESRIGFYDQYANYFTTDISETDAKEIEIYPLDTREYWSIKLISDDTAIEDVVDNNQVIDGWIGYIKEKFTVVSEIESINYIVDKKKIDIWIILPDRNLQIIRQIIDIEMEVLDIFDDDANTVFDFGFHIIYRCGFSEQNVLPVGTRKM